MKKKFRLQAYTSDNRHLTIDQIQKLINRYDGFLMNHRMYSDLQMSMYVEMKEYRLLNFYHNLCKQFRISGFDIKNFDPHSRKTCRIYLNVYFIKGVGKLKVRVPRVPG